MTSCYEWYTVKYGDTCETIESEYGITLDYLRSLNTYVDAACDNMWVGDAYCVNGAVQSTSSASTTSVTS